MVEPQIHRPSEIYEKSLKFGAAAVKERLKAGDFRIVFERYASADESDMTNWNVLAEETRMRILDRISSTEKYLGEDDGIYNARVRDQARCLAYVIYRELTMPGGSPELARRAYSALSGDTTGETALRPKPKQRRPDVP